MSQANQIQTKLEQETRDLQTLQREQQKIILGRQKLIEQQSETEIVKKEFDLLQEGTKILKFIDPVLIPQTLSESKQTVAKRLEFILKEQKRIEQTQKENEQKIVNKRAKIQGLQVEYQKLQMTPEQQKQLQEQMKQMNV